MHSITLHACLSEPTTKIWMQIDPYCQRRKCSPVNVVSSDKGDADIRRGSGDMGRQTRKWSSNMPIFVWGRCVTFALVRTAVSAAAIISLWCRQHPVSVGMHTALVTQCCRAFTLALARLSCQVIVSYLLQVANFNIPHLHLALQLGVILFEFHQDFWHRKTKVPGLLCGTGSVLLHLAVLTQWARVTDGWTNGQTDRHTTTAYTALA